MSGIDLIGGVFLWLAVISFMLVLLTALVIASGILVAPIAGVLTGIATKRKRYAFINGFWRGMLFSASGLLPWIYVAITMKGWRLPRLLIVLGFILMHVLWLAAIIMIFFLIYERVEDFNSYSNYDPRLPDDEIALTFGLTSACCWIVASYRLLAKHNNWYDEDLTNVMGMPNMSGILHFTIPTAWVIGAALMLFATTDLGLSETGNLIVVSIIAGLLIVATTVWTLWGFVDCYRSH